MNYTIDDLITELMEDKEWEIPEQMKASLVPALAWTLFAL